MINNVSQKHILQFLIRYYKNGRAEPAINKLLNLSLILLLLYNLQVKSEFQTLFRKFNDLSLKSPRKIWGE